MSAPDAEEIRPRTAGVVLVTPDGGLVGSLPADAPTEDALARNVLRSPSSATTLIPARMWVVFVPPSASFPTTRGFTNQCSG